MSRPGAFARDGVRFRRFADDHGVALLQLENRHARVRQSQHSGKFPEWKKCRGWRLPAMLVSAFIASVLQVLRTILP